MEFINWFFFNEGREPDGLFSLTHILTITIILLSLSFLAFFLGKKYKNDQKAIDKILKI